MIVPTFRRFRMACVLLPALTGVVLPGQIQPHARYRGKLLPVVACTQVTRFVVDEGKRQAADSNEIEIKPAAEFGPGMAQIGSPKVDLDPLQSATPEKRADPTSVRFRYEVDVTAEGIALKECYGLLTFTSNGSVGTHLVPIGGLSPGRARHLKIELMHRVDSVGLLHVFANGREMKSSMVPAAYDAREYFTRLTRGTKGVSAVALCRSEERYEHVLSLDGNKLATLRKRDTHNSLIVYDLVSMKLLRDIKLGDKGEEARDLTWISDHELVYIADDLRLGPSSSLMLLDIGTGKTEKLKESVDGVVSALKKQPNIVALFGRHWEDQTGIVKYDVQKRRVVSKAALDQGQTFFDDNGDERIRFEDDGDGWKCFYKPTPDASWRPLNRDVKDPRLNFDRRGKGMLDRTCEIHSIGPDGDTLYISTRLKSDCFELVAFSLSKCEREFGKVAGFGENQLGDARNACGADPLPPAEQHHAQQVEGAALELVHDAADLGDRRHQPFAHDGLEQLFLVLEIQIQRSLGDAGARGDIFQACTGIAALDEQLQRCGSDFLGTRMLASRPSRLGFGVGCHRNKNN